MVAIEDAERRARLAALAGGQPHVAEAPLLLVWLIDFDRLARLGEREGRTPLALDYTETFLLGAVDASLAAQNAVVALESLALGSVYIGGIRNDPVAVAAELALPPRLFPLFGLVVGRPDPARPASVKPRLPQAAVLHREQYRRTPEQAGAVDRYDVHLRAFQREQGMAEVDWTTLALRRTAGPESMAGRHRLREILHQRGFALL